VLSKLDLPLAKLARRVQLQSEHVKKLNCVGHPEELHLLAKLLAQASRAAENQSNLFGSRPLGRNQIRAEVGPQIQILTVALRVIRQASKQFECVREMTNSLLVGEAPAGLSPGQVKILNGLAYVFALTVVTRQLV
jgi:hypothetical protein